MQRSLVSAVIFAVLAVSASACRHKSGDETSETTLTSGVIQPLLEAHERTDARPAEASDNDEMVAAFRLETSEVETRLQLTVDGLDGAIANTPPGRRRDDAMLQELVTRRDLLKGDLASVSRATEEEWATLRTKVEGDLNTAEGTQLPVRR